jgi:hypothetical protein
MPVQQNQGRNATDLNGGLEKAQELFCCEDWAEDRHIAERMRLPAIKGDPNSARSLPPGVIDTTSVLAEWNPGHQSPATTCLKKRSSTGFLVSKQETGYRPRADLASEVAPLMGGLLGSLLLATGILKPSRKGGWELVTTAEKFERRVSMAPLQAPSPNNPGARQANTGLPGLPHP